MDNHELQKHYVRIMRELEDERLMTFEEMVKVTKMPPEVLKKTIPVLARGLCCYQKLKADFVEDEDLDEHWTVQDMEGIVDFEEKGDRGTVQKCHKDKAIKGVKAIENKENVDLVDREGKKFIKDETKDEDHDDVFSESGDNAFIDDNPRSKEDDEMMSFEDLVKLTGSHPFYLERCVCHLAMLAETES